MLLGKHTPVGKELFGRGTARSRLKKKYGDRDLMILHVARRMNSITLSGLSFD